MSYPLLTENELRATVSENSAHLENDSLKLDVTLGESAPHITVTDKRTGAVWETAGPSFVLHYWDSLHYAIRTQMADSAVGWEFKLVHQQDRILIQNTWPRAACGFRVMFRLEGPALEVTIPGKRIVENRPFDVRQMAIDVFSLFGAARTGDAGFMLIPSGRGVICKFDKNCHKRTSLLYYAGHEPSLSAPVFGISREQGGMLGIIEHGEFNAELVLISNGGGGGNLNGLHPRFRIRFNAGDAIDEDLDFRVLYHFLEPGDSTTVGMAKVYRNHLLTKRDEPNFAERCKQSPALAQAATCSSIIVNLAEKRRAVTMLGDGELVVRTRFEEAAQIASTLKQKGVDRAMIVFSGWNCEGRDGLYPTRFPVEAAAGGADAMSRAAANISALGYQVGALDNYTDIYRRAPTFNTDLTAKQPGGEHWRGGVWAGGQAYILCPHQALTRHVPRDMRRLRDLGIKDIIVLDHFPGSGVLSCSHHEHPLTRGQYANTLQQIIESAKTTFGTCRISGHAVFAALKADSIMLPVKDTPKLGNLDEEWFADETVPFLPVALHGILLLTAEPDGDQLRAAEYGASPVFWTSTGEAGKSLDRIGTLSRRYTSEIAPLATQYIDKHEIVGDGLIRVRYESGTSVLINRTDNPADIAGTEVAAKEYKVVTK